MSEMPRTEEAITTCQPETRGARYVDAQFARQLECELSRAIAERDAAVKERDATRADYVVATKAVLTECESYRMEVGRQLTDLRTKLAAVEKERDERDMTIYAYSTTLKAYGWKPATESVHDFMRNYDLPLRARCEGLETAVEDIGMAAAEFISDWKKGDFVLPKLAQCDASSLDAMLKKHVGISALTPQPESAAGTTIECPTCGKIKRTAGLQPWFCDCGTEMFPAPPEPKAPEALSITKGGDEVCADTKENAPARPQSIRSVSGTELTDSASNRGSDVQPEPPAKLKGEPCPENENARI